MKLFYTAGAYRSKDGMRGIHKNIEVAKDAAYEIWCMGGAVICPHSNTAFFDSPALDWQTFINGDLEMIGRCDAIVRLPGWLYSPGACAEHTHAVEHGLKIFSWPLDKDLIEEYIKGGKR